jgi:hypothetical protein
MENRFYLTLHRINRNLSRGFDQVRNGRQSFAG